MKDLPIEPVGQAPEPVSQKVFVTDFRKGEFFKIFLMNLVLMIMTLGLYRFWAKTRERKYLFARIQILGDGLEYHGTGGELFKGFLIVFFLVFLPIFILPSFFMETLIFENQSLFLLIVVLQGLCALILFPIAIYRSYRYLFSRLSWRGVRFSLAKGEAGFCYRYMLILLGLVPSWFRSLYCFVFNRLSFGDKKFELNFGSGPLWSMYFLNFVIFMIIGGVLAVVFTPLANFLLKFFKVGDDQVQLFVLGLVVMGYLLFGLIGILGTALFKGRLYQLVVNNLTYDVCSFHTDFKLFAYFRLMFGNVLILGFTLGLGYPLVLARNIRFWANNLSATQLEVFERVIHIERDELNTGEGLAANFDIGGI